MIPTLVLLLRLSQAERAAPSPLAGAEGGTRLFPGEDGTPRPGAFASLGLGVEHVR